MKTLKFNHQRAELIREGKITVTWRVNDEKNLSVDDDVWIIDKVDKKDPSTWRAIGTAKITEILAKHLGNVTNEELVECKECSSKVEVVKTFRQYYGPDINEKTPVKIIHFVFTPQEPQPLESIEDKDTTDLTEIKLYADGGSRGNPGPSASGYVLMTMDDAIIFQGGQYMGITTNNQAEYNALKLGLEEAAKHGAQIVHIFLDSLLVINQMKGSYKVKHKDLAPVYQGIQQFIQSHFKQVSFTHVPRELNKLADAMVNEVLDATDLS
ncbi:MAG: reverse transcriptase-like protein [Candidatus Paceibacterota bacterium]|jgi:ribonuclease HI